MSISPDRERRHEPRPAGRRGSFTVDDYMALTEFDDKRYEVLDGELVMTPSPMTRHQRVARNLFVALIASKAATSAGEFFFAPYDVILGANTVCQPDILFVRSERASIIGDKNVQGAPDLVVEVLSPSTRKRDAVVKRALYAQAGVAHCWILDPDERTLEEYVLDPAAQTFRQGALLDRPADVFTPALFPELSIELAKVWE